MAEQHTNRQKGTAMYSRFTKALLSLAAVAALAAPGIAQASRGSDDPANHVQREHQRFDRHHRRDNERQRHRDRHHRDRPNHNRGDDHGRDG